MPSAESLASFLLASTLLSIAPGPDNLFVLTQSALYGRRSGLLITLGLCSGLLVHTSAVALGVAALIQASDTAFNLLRLAGVGYLLYLAWLAFGAESPGLRGPGSTLHSAMALYRRGIVMNLTNPKVTIFFLAFLPQFASPEGGSLAAQIGLLGALFMLTALIIFCAIALLAGSLRPWLNDSPKAQRGLGRLAGIVFVLLAMKLAFANPLPA